MIDFGTAIAETSVHKSIVLSTTSCRQSFIANLIPFGCVDKKDRNLQMFLFIRI